jgi:hypothetical protein
MGRGDGARAPVPVGAAQPGEDLKALRQEVDALKSGQAAIHRELRNIRWLLRADSQIERRTTQELLVVRGPED